KDAEKTAEKVRKEILDKSTTFEKMAAKYNTDQTKTTGGSLGYVAYDSTQFLPEFMSAAKKLKNGEISQPVKTKYGYHLIKVESVMEKPGIMPFDYVKDNIKDTLLSSEKQKAYNDTIKKWEDEIGVKVYEDKLQS
ncbi:peptidylprolyl isomerase, partial [Clostridium sardiniense]|uniref:peptidylprolyl isomerase n=1 Tax=Clostridium sardiniense TaxID=29369 RepID=UPI003D32DDB7